MSSNSAAAHRSWPDELGQAMSSDHQLEKAMSAKASADRLMESGAPAQTVDIMKRDADHWSTACGMPLE
jgi:hypothetical protein